MRKLNINKKRTPEFGYLVCNRCLVEDAKTVDDVIGAYQGAVKTLSAMRDPEVRVELGENEGHVYLVTKNPEVAKRLGFLRIPEDALGLRDTHN